MTMNGDMTSRRVTRACFAIAALAFLACAQGCRESMHPAVRRIRSTSWRSTQCISQGNAMSLRPYVILAMFLSLATSFAVFTSGCSWGTDNTSAPTATPSPMATHTLASTPPVDMVQPTQSPVDSPTPTGTLVPTATPTMISYPPYPWPSPHPTITPYPTVVTVDPTTTPCGHLGFSGLQDWQLQRFLQWSPDGSKILFDTQGLDRYTYPSELAIRSVDSDGFWMREIASASIPEIGTLVGAMTYFDVSPDGSKVVYSTCKPPPSLSPSYIPGGDIPREYTYEIVVSNIDGSEPEVLSQNEYFDNYPVWSSDGSRIAFVSSRPGSDVGRLPRYRWEYQQSIFTMAPDGTDVRNIISPSSFKVAYHPPVWAPDDMRIAFVAIEDTRHVAYVVNSDGSNLTRIFETFSVPSWSPSGERIALAVPEGNGVSLYTFRADGSAPVRVTAIITDSLQLDSYWVENVSWSHDGLEILFTGGGLLTTTHGSVDNDRVGFSQYKCGIACIVRVNDSHVWELPSRATRYGYISSWSPDGSRIAVRAVDVEDYGGVMLFTIGRDGLDRRILVTSDGEDRLVLEYPTRRIDSCSGSTAFPNSRENSDLSHDCETLVDLLPTLVGDRYDIIQENFSIPIEEWPGVTVSGSLPRVQAVSRIGTYMNGSVPPKLGDLSGLKRLDLSYNNSLSGLIPSELGNLTELEYLDLQGNQLLRGPIPPELGDLPNLQVLNLSNNQLTGSIPPELGNLTNLRELHLAHNQLTGPIPPELGNLPSLEKVSLGGKGNRFTGCVPTALVDKIVDIAALGLPPCEESSDGR